MNEGVIMFKEAVIFFKSLLRKTFSIQFDLKSFMRLEEKRSYHPDKAEDEIVKGRFGF